MIRKEYDCKLSKTHKYVSFGLVYCHNTKGKFSKLNKKIMVKMTFVESHLTLKYTPTPQSAF